MKKFNKKQLSEDLLEALREFSIEEWKNSKDSKNKIAGAEKFVFTYIKKLED